MVCGFIISIYKTKSIQARTVDAIVVLCCKIKRKNAEKKILKINENNGQKMFFLNHQKVNFIKKLINNLKRDWAYIVRNNFTCAVSWLWLFI